MAGGWSADGDTQKQIDDTINDAVVKIKSKLPAGDSLLQCEECGEDIAENRRLAVPGVRFCLSCQSESEEKGASFELYNRRGSKDSQLR